MCADKSPLKIIGFKTPKMSNIAKKGMEVSMIFLENYYTTIKSE